MILLIHLDMHNLLTEHVLGATVLRIPSLALHISKQLICNIGFSKFQSLYSDNILGNLSPVSFFNPFI